MYGLVHRGIKEFLLKTAGTDTWALVCSRAGVVDDGFEDLRAYPDAETYALIQAASTELAQPMDAVLRAFGRHWVLFTAESAYGDLLEKAGDRFEGVMVNLDALHQMVGRSMPDLRPPSFEVTDSENDWIVEYYSERSGLAPMVLGLLEGLLELFGNEGTVERLSDARSGASRFLVTLLT